MKEVRPFAEQGHYVEAHNLLFDHIMPRVKPTSFKVLCFILRRTKGWGKASEELPYSAIKKGTGINSDTTISHALCELLEGGYILKKEGATKFDSGRFALNKDFAVPTAQSTSPKTEASPENGVGQPPPDHSINWSDPAPQNDVYSTPKNEDTKSQYKSTYPGTGGPAADRPLKPTAASQKPTASRQKLITKSQKLKANHPVRLELARAWGRDLASPATTVKERTLIADATARFVASGVAPETIPKIEAWWYAHDWRGQKNEPPSPQQLLAAHQEMQTGKRAHANGGANTGNPHATNRPAPPHARAEQTSEYFDGLAARRADLERRKRDLGLA